MTDLALVRLLQIFDSQFPVGSFAHSGGLETYSQVPGFDRAALEEWLRAQILYGWGRLDLAAVALAWDRATDPDALAELNCEVDAFRTVPTLRAASEKVGRRMSILLKRLYPAEMVGLAVDPPHQPVIGGAAAARLGLPRNQAVLAYAQSALTAQLAAATRCLRLSPEQSQETLVALTQPLIRSVERVLANAEANLFSATPAAEIRAWQQSGLHTRLFQS